MDGFQISPCVEASLVLLALLDMVHVGHVLRRRRVVHLLSSVAVSAVTWAQFSASLALFSMAMDAGAYIYRRSRATHIRQHGLVCFDPKISTPACTVQLSVSPNYPLWDSCVLKESIYHRIYWGADCLLLGTYSISKYMIFYFYINFHRLSYLKRLELFFILTIVWLIK
jgi:hypothetical protein